VSAAKGSAKGASEESKELAAEQGAKPSAQTSGNPSAQTSPGTNASPLTPEDAFQALKAYFETRQASKKAIGTLRAGVEIGISIGGAVDCALFQSGGMPKVEKRKAAKPDFSFVIRPETVYVLSKQPSEEVGDVGIAVLKEIIAGNVSVRMTGSLMSALSGGYLDMLKEGGAKFASTLAANGLSGAGKIMAAIKKMRG
jgi:hypothetical protein